MLSNFAKSKCFLKKSGDLGTKTDKVILTIKSDMHDFAIPHAQM